MLPKSHPFFDQPYSICFFQNLANLLFFFSPFQPPLMNTLSLLTLFYIYSVHAPLSPTVLTFGLLHSYLLSMSSSVSTTGWDLNRSYMYLGSSLFHYKPDCPIQVKVPQRCFQVVQEAGESSLIFKIAELFFCERTCWKSCNPEN